MCRPNGGRIISLERHGTAVGKAPSTGWRTFATPLLDTFLRHTPLLTTGGSWNA